MNAMDIHGARAQELFRKLAASYILREGGTRSLITVTRAALTDRGAACTIFVTVLPSSEESGALAFLNRRARHFRGFVAEAAHLRRLPSFTFALDEGELNRQKIDALSRGS